MLRILYIEDDFMTALLIQEWLQHEGYAVDWANTADEGKQRLKNQHYDVLIVDYLLPEMTGLELLHLLGDAQLRLPVIMLTGAGDEQTAVEAMKSGVTDYLLKAQIVQQPQLLVSAIANAVEKQRIFIEKQQAELALRQSEELYHQLFECSKAVKLLVDPIDGRIIDANTAAQEYYGYSKECLRQMFIGDINMLSQEELYAEMCRAKEEKRNHFKFRHRLASGEIRHVEVHSGPFTASHRTLLYSIVHDITDRVRAEQALIESEKRFRLMADSAPVFIWMSDTTGGCIYFNKVWLEFTGRNLSDECGDGWTHNIHPEDYQLCMSTYRTAFIKREAFRVEYRMLRHMDHSYCWLLDIGVPRFNKAEEFAGYIGTCVDISERKQMETQLQQLLDQQAVILNNMPMGIAFVDQERRFIRVNRKMEELFGYSEQELLGQSTQLIYTTHTDWQYMGDEVYPKLRQGETYHLERFMRRKEGTNFWCRLLGKAVNPLDQSQGSLWSTEDITEKRQTEEKLRLAAAVFQTSSEGIFVTDAQHGNSIIMVNPAFTEITGYTAHEVLGKHPSVIVAETYYDEIIHTMHNTLSETGKWQGEIISLRKNKEEYPAWVSISAIKNNEDEVTQYVAVFNDITERKKNEEILQHRINHDELTGLPNRTLFLKRLADTIAHAKTHSTQLALCFIDLDHFKWVNDTFGHDVGNLLLIDVANRLRQCVRDSDIVTRLSGDEFTIILPNLAKPNIVQVIITRVITALARTFQLAGHNLTISASVGIAIYPQDGDDIQTLLKHADIAMYAAKGAGRNNYQFYHD